MHTSAVDGYDIDPERRYYLSGEFSLLLSRLGNLLQQCTNVDNLKNFLRFFSHPLYPEKLYIEPCVYCDAKTATDVISSLTPMYINFIDHNLLQQIVDKFGNDECKHHYQKYEQTFQRLVRKLRHHPAPITDDEQCSSQKRLRVSVDGDVNRTTLQDMQTVQTAITQATGIGQAGLVYANQDPGNSIILSFLIPHSCIELFNELCNDDLAILASAGVTRVQVEDLDITGIKQHTVGLKKVKKPSSFTTRASRESVKQRSFEHYLRERQDIQSQECSDLIAMVKMISDTQLNDMCSEELLLEFSSSIQDWRVLAPFLGMPDFYYDEFTTRYPTVADQNYQLLLYWKRCEGQQAIYRHLLETVTLHGKTEEVWGLTQIPLKVVISDNIGDMLKKRYKQHAMASRNSSINVNSTLVQLKTHASDILKGLDYSTRLETVVEFGDDVETVSPKQVMNTIAATDSGNYVLVTGPRGIGKTKFITRLCNYWALGGLRRCKLLFWIDLSTAQDQPFNNAFELLCTALLPVHTFTKAELRNVLSSVVKTKGEHVLVILDHFSQQHNQLLSQLLELKVVTVVVSSSFAVEDKSCHTHFHMLGLTDRQISQLVLHYYCNSHYRAEHFLQYLSSVPNFSYLRRIPVYLLGLLSVFDVTSTAHPPQTLTSFLFCLTLIMLNLSQDELEQMMGQIATKPLLDMFGMIPSPSLSLLRSVGMVLFENSKSLLHKTELTVLPISSSFLRPVQVALPLKSGEWFQLTQYPLLNDFLASLYLSKKYLPAKGTVQTLRACKKLQYFCLKIFPHIQEEFGKQATFIAQISYMYEEAESYDGSTTTAKLHNTAVTARTMYYLTSAIKEIVFSACDLSLDAAVVLSSSIGNDSCVKYYSSEITYTSSDSATMQSKSVESGIHSLMHTDKPMKYMTSSTRFDRYSWLFYMKRARSFAASIKEIEYVDTFIFIQFILELLALEILKAHKEQQLHLERPPHEYGH